MSKESKTINQKLKELGDLIEWFNGDDFELEQAIEKYKLAATLTEDIEDTLNNLKNEVNVIKQSFDK